MRHVPCLPLTANCQALLRSPRLANVMDDAPAKDDARLKLTM